MANQLLVDQVSLPERRGWLLPLITAVSIATVAQIGVSVVRERVLITLGHALDLSLVSDFINHLLHLPLRFLEQRSKGDLMQRVQANSNLRELSTALVTAGLDALLVLSYGGLMLAYKRSWARS